MIRRNQGFTLVELSISMAFIAVLLLSVATLVIQIGIIYNKGLTMRAINQTGTTVTNDMQRTLAASKTEKIKFVNDAGTSTGGRMCVTSTVYAWNFGKFLTSSTAFNKYASGTTDIRLVKFTGGASYCSKDGSGAYPVIPDNATKLINNGESNIAIQAMDINQQGGTIGQPIVGDATQRMYRVTMTVGTNETNVINDSSCANRQSGVDDSYCAVNKFVFSARTEQ